MAQMHLWSTSVPYERPLIVHYGGGTDSTAMLIELHRLRVVPDMIVMADTGNEKPWTYTYVGMFSKWLTDRGMPPVTWVRRRASKPSKTGPGYETLEGNALQNHTLPSIAFGRKACSLKWKVQPMDQLYKSMPMMQSAWAAGIKPTKLLGYDSGPADSRRAVGRTEDALFRFRYPLREWGWSRENCIAVIHAVGLPQPGKSACFFCPASKPWELIQLAQQHPDLWMRAVHMEDIARPHLTSTAGLWRRMSWRQFGMQHGLPLPPLPRPEELIRAWVPEDAIVDDDDVDLTMYEDDACYQEEAPL